MVAALGLPDARPLAGDIHARRKPSRTYLEGFDCGLLCRVPLSSGRPPTAFACVAAPDTREQSSRYLRAAAWQRECRA
jgi:hypothetical protein